MARSESLHRQAEYIAADHTSHSNFLLAIRRRTIHRFGAGVRIWRRRAAHFGKESARTKGGALSAARRTQIERQTGRELPYSTAFPHETARADFPNFES